LQFVREINGVKIYNDNNATTPDATIAALRALAPNVGLTKSHSEDDVLDVKITANRGHDGLCHLGIAKELPVTFRLPGNQPLTEQVFYNLLVGFLSALTQTGVAVCGTGAVEPLSGRTETPGPKA